MQCVVYKTPTEHYQAKTKVDTIQWALFYTSTSFYLILNCDTPVQDIYIKSIQYLNCFR